MNHSQDVYVGALPEVARPGLRGLWELMRDPIGYAERATRELGGLCEMPFIGMKVLLVSDPDIIEQVLLKQHEAFEKDFLTRALRDVLGNGLLTSGGDHWRKQRRLIQPVFHPKRISQYASQMLTESLAMRARIAGSPGVRDVRGEMAELALRIVATVLFDTEIATGEIQAVEHLLAQTMQRAQSLFGLGFLLPAWVPTPANLRFAGALHRLDELVLRLIDRRAAWRTTHSTSDGGAPANLLDRLLDLRDEDGRPLSRRELRDECTTFFLGGHETTALTLTYALHLLAHHPDAQDALQRELDLLGDAPVTVGQLPQMRMTRAIISETLRLYPPAWCMGREAKAAVQLGDYRVKAGTQLWLSTYNVQRDARFYAEPERFVPERWLSGELEQRLPRFAYMPFGGGPRVCIGNSFALTSAMLALATLGQGLRFTPAAGYSAQLELVPGGLLLPANPVRLDVQPRRRCGA